MKKITYTLLAGCIFAACKKKETNAIAVTNAVSEIVGTYKGAQGYRGYTVSYGDTTTVDWGNAMDITIIPLGNNYIGVASYRDTIRMMYTGHNQPNIAEVELKNGHIQCILTYNNTTDSLNITQRVDSVSTAYIHPWGTEYEKTDITYKVYCGKVK